MPPSEQRLKTNGSAVQSSAKCPIGPGGGLCGKHHGPQRPTGTRHLCVPTPHPVAPPFAIHPDRTVLCALSSFSTRSATQPGSNSKLKSYPRTACLKLHLGDLHWSFVCSQTLVYRRSPGSLPRMATLLFPPPTWEGAAHCCPVVWPSF